MKIKKGVYRHFKGKEYFVYGIVRHSETLEELVLYDCLYDNPSGTTWVRPVSMFTEEIVRDGKKQKRFEWVREK